MDPALEAAKAVPKFEVFSLPHWAALGACALLLVCMIIIARGRRPAMARALELSLGVILLAQWPLSLWVFHQAGELNVDTLYPCHLCDYTAFLAAMALFTHRQIFCELVYFWGLAGTLQGLITPELTPTFPNPRYLLFFIAHGGVVITALYGVLGLRKTPRASAKWRCWALINVYALVVGLFNYLMGANYGFLCRKPATASLYDFLGPWPWYVGSASLLALTIFLLLDTPFMAKRRRS